MSPYGLVIPWETISFPRVSGDEPLIPGLRVKRVLFSPRERG